MDYTDFATFLRDQYDVILPLPRMKYYFPIKEISGLHCRVVLVFSSCEAHHHMVFKVYNRRIHCIIDVENDGSGEVIYYLKDFILGNNGQDVSIEKIANALKAIYEMLPQFKFNKYNGELETDTKRETFIPFLKEFISHANIKSDMDDCCVCYESTLTHTDCGHSLCYMCWENIHSNGYDQHEEINIHPCPICRVNLCKLC